MINYLFSKTIEGYFFIKNDFIESVEEDVLDETYHIYDLGVLAAVDLLNFLFYFITDPSLYQEVSNLVKRCLFFNLAFLS